MLYDCERALIGCIVADESVYERVAHRVSTEDFRDSLNRQLINAVAQLIRDGQPVDPILLAQRVGEQHADYIHKLVEEIPAVGHAEQYADAVHQLAIRERTQVLCKSLADAQTTEEFDRCRAQLQAMLAHNDHMVPGTGVATVAEAMARYLDPSESLDGGLCGVVSTGYGQLDALLKGGLLPGGLYILGARTGIGKTSLALSIADSAARRGLGTLYVSLEMSQDELGAKLLARATGFNSGHILMRRLTPEENEEKNAAAKDLADRPLYISDRTSINVDGIKAMAKSIPDLGLLVIDYIGLLAMSNKSSRYEAVTAASRQLKLLARDLGVPILALSQLRRECDGGFNVEPKLSELRDSGALEQDADAVLLLWRTGTHRKVGTAEMAELKLELAKNRHGPTGRIILDLHAETSRFFVVTYNDK